MLLVVSKVVGMRQCSVEEVLVLILAGVLELLVHHGLELSLLLIVKGGGARLEAGVGHLLLLGLLGLLLEVLLLAILSSSAKVISLSNGGLKEILISLILGNEVAVAGSTGLK